MNTQTKNEAPVSNPSLRRYVVPAGVLAAGVIALLAIFSLNGAEEEVTFVGSDGPAYASVEELERAADVTAVATVGEITEFSDSRNGEGPERTVAVVELDTQDLPNNSYLVLTSYPENVIAEGAATLRTGENVVLFLRKLDKQDPNTSADFQAGINAVDGDIYALVGRDQGVFDVVGGAASPRNHELQEEIGDVAIDSLSIATDR